MNSDGDIHTIPVKNYGINTLRWLLHFFIFL